MSTKTAVYEYRWVVKHRQSGELTSTWYYYVDEEDLRAGLDPAFEVVGPLANTASSTSKVQVWDADIKEGRVRRRWVIRNRVAHYPSSFEEAKAQLIEGLLNRLRLQTERIETEEAIRRKVQKQLANAEKLTSDDFK